MTTEPETENPIVTIARLIDPEAWAHAEEYAAMVNVATPQMQPFFTQQVQRITKASLEASIRVIRHLQPAPAETEPTIPDVLSEVTKPKQPNRKARRANKDAANEG
jgi:hypothetical protein